MMKKILGILTYLVGILLAAALIILLGLNISRPILYHEYISNKEDVSRIPGLSDDFVPQGIAYVDEKDAYLHSGYNGHQVEVYCVIGKESRLYHVLDENNAILDGHGGGIADCGEFVYLACNSKVYVYRLADFLNGKDGDTVALVASYKVDTPASFCFVLGNELLVGEFYEPVKYETDPTHHYTTPEGDVNHAIVSSYTILGDGSLTDTPNYHISLPDRVQGFAVNKDGIIALSCSWSINSSKLIFFDNVQKADKEITEGVPLYYVGEKNLIKTVRMPAMSEGLDLMGDRVIISFESACNKYIFGKFFFAFDVASYPFPKS
jgi:hypothetical protein